MGGGWGKMIVILSDSCLLYHWGGGIACFLTLDVRFIWNSKCFQTVPRSNICWMYCACVSFASHLTAVHSPGCKVSEDLVKFLIMKLAVFLVWMGFTAKSWKQFTRAQHGGSNAAPPPCKEWECQCSSVDAYKVFFLLVFSSFFFSPHCLLAAWLAADFVLYHAVMVMHRQSDRDTPFFIYSKFLLW